MTDTAANKPEDTAEQNGEAQNATSTSDSTQESAAPVGDPTAEWKSRVAYLSAEIENMRKRFARERLDLIKTAAEDVVVKLLPVLDNLELGLKAAQSTAKEHPVLSNLIKGLEMTVKGFEQTLEAAGASPIKSLGQAFDPAQHEAISQSQSADAADNVVTSEVQRGYTMNGRTIRPARVVVNKLVN